MKVYGLLILAAITLFSSCAKESGDGDGLAAGSGESTENSVAYSAPLQVLKEREEFSTMLEIIESNGLESALTTEGKLTFFAPTNSAFDTISESALENLKTNPERAKAFLDNLIVDEEHNTQALQEMDTLTTRSGKIVSVERANGYLWVEGAPLMSPDLSVPNGYVHGVGSIY